MAGGLGGSTSMRNAGVKRSDVKGLLRHHFRDVDRSHGVEVKHSNADIVDIRTSWNESFVNDGDGGVKSCSDVKEVADYIDKKLDGLPPRTRVSKKTGKVTEIKTREDFPVVRDWVLQLDPEAMKEYNELVELEQRLRDEEDVEEAESVHELVERERQEIRRLLMVMVDTVREEVGAENFVGGSIHWDETNPHAQILTLPIHEDKLNWKAFRPGTPKGLAQFHDVMRQNLRDAGYAAFEERISGPRAHLPQEEFKRTKDLLTRAVELGDATAQLTHAFEMSRQAELHMKRHGAADERMQRLDVREAQLTKRQGDVEKSERSLAPRESAVAQRETAADEETRKLGLLSRHLEAQRKALQEKEAEVETLKLQAQTLLTTTTSDVDRRRQELQQDEAALQQRQVELDRRVQEVESLKLATENALKYADHLIAKVQEVGTRERLQEQSQQAQQVSDGLRGRFASLRRSKPVAPPETPRKPSSPADW